MFGCRGTLRSIFQVVPLGKFEDRRYQPQENKGLMIMNGGIILRSISTIQLGPQPQMMLELPFI